MHLAVDQYLIDHITLGDAAKSQRLSTWMSTINSLISFALRPAAGSLVDACGRKTFLVLCPLLAALARCILLLKPSSRSYVVYRLFINLANMPLWPAIQAYVRDSRGRGTARYSMAMQRMGFVLTLVGLAALRVGYNLNSSKRNIAFSCLINVAAALAFLLFAPETLASKHRKPVSVSSLVKKSNPLSFLSVFSKSRTMKAMAFLHFMSYVPEFDVTSRNAFRKRFGWKTREMAKLMFYNQISGLVEGWLCPERYIVPYLGAKRTLQVANLLSAFADFNCALTPQKSSWTIYLNSFLWPLIHGRSMLDALVSQEAKDLAIGDGELSAAQSNLTFPLQFGLPSVYTELFARFQHRFPQVNQVATGVSHLLFACIYVPTLYGEFESLAKKVETNYGKDVDEIEVDVKSN